MRKKILFIGGSLNQTTMLHKIALELSEHDCFFTPFYAEGLIGSLAKTGLLKHSILGGAHLKATNKYIAAQNIPRDTGGNAHPYDLVVTGTDLLVQRNIRNRRLILVQEGITEPEDLIYGMVRQLNLPRWLANTAATGLSNAYDLFCVASPGYRDLFIRKGVKPQKIVVTGIPNFDNAATALRNDFPYHDYVLIATSSIRETGKYDDRIGFLRRAARIAASRQVLVKLHPNEEHNRATREIKSILPDALIFTEGNINAMIANCAVLAAQVSSVVYTAIALGKEVYSYHDKAELERLAPIQNGGTSAARIADTCRHLLGIPMHQLRPQPGTTGVQQVWGSVMKAFQQQ